MQVDERLADFPAQLAKVERGEIWNTKKHNGIAKATDCKNGRPELAVRAEVEELLKHLLGGTKRQGVRSARNFRSKES